MTDDQNKNNEGGNADDKNKKGDEGKGGDEGQKVDYAKLKAERDKRKELEDRLAKIEADEAKKKEDLLLAEKKYQELLDQKSKDLEKTASELAAERATAKRSKIENAIITESAKLKAKDAADVVKFIDLNTIELDDSGKPVGLEDVLKKVKESKPYLFEDGGKGGSNPNENGRPGNTNQNAGGQAPAGGVMSSNKTMNSIMDSLKKARS